MIFFSFPSPLMYALIYVFINQFSPWNIKNHTFLIDKMSVYAFLANVTITPHFQAIMTRLCKKKIKIILHYFIYLKRKKNSYIIHAFLSFGDIGECVEEKTQIKNRENEDRNAHFKLPCIWINQERKNCTFYLYSFLWKTHSNICETGIDRNILFLKWDDTHSHIKGAQH